MLYLSKVTPSSNDIYGSLDRRSGNHNFLEAIIAKVPPPGDIDDVDTVVCHHVSWAKIAGKFFGNEINPPRELSVMLLDRWKNEAKPTNGLPNN